MTSGLLGGCWEFIIHRQGRTIVTVWLSGVFLALPHAAWVPNIEEGLSDEEGAFAEPHEALPDESYVEPPPLESEEEDMRSQTSRRLRTMMT